MKLKMFSLLLSCLIAVTTFAGFISPPDVGSNELSLSISIPTVIAHETLIAPAEALTAPAEALTESQFVDIGITAAAVITLYHFAAGRYINNLDYYDKESLSSFRRLHTNTTGIYRGNYIDAWIYNADSYNII